MKRLLRPALVVAAAALVLRVDPVLGVAAGLATWAALSWWLPGRAVADVRMERSHPPRVFHGEQVHIDYDVRARGAVPWLSVFDAIPFDLGPSMRWVTSVGRGEVTRHSVVIEASRRGLHHLGPSVITSGDVFAGHTVQAAGAKPSALLVYPRIVAITELGLSARTLDQLRPTRRTLPPDPSRVVGVRPYGPDDSLRTVHWTATARTGELQVKKLQPATSRAVFLAVDLSMAHHPAPGRRRSAELAITAAASIAHHLITVVGEPVALRSWSLDQPSGTPGSFDTGSGSGPGHLSRILETLARSDLVRGSPVGGLLDPAGVPFGSAVVLLTGVVVERHVGPLVRARNLGHDVAVVSTAAGRHRTEWDGYLESLGVPVSHIGFYDEIGRL